MDFYPVLYVFSVLYVPYVLSFLYIFLELCFLNSL